MEKKYQVFLSSTYMDLIDERKKVLDVLLTTGCIPAGMESFVATDDEQFNVIKKVIDLCDYYILIIAGRYGSINETTGLSYTEMEYNYALEKKIPVLVFVIDDSVELDEDKKDTDVTMQAKLKEFKSKAMKNRLASIWKDTNELALKVITSVMQAQQSINRPGWIRGGEDTTELLRQIASLQAQNDMLRTELEEYKNSSLNNVDLPFYDHEIQLHYTEKVYFFTSNTVIQKKIVRVTLDKLFKFISLRLTGRHKAIEFEEAVSEFQSGYYVNSQDALIVKNQYIQLGLFKTFINENDEEILELTEKGKCIMNELNTIR